jgi:hypothetical protein
MRRISTKKKRELYSLSSLLFHLTVFILLLISLGSDAEENKMAQNKKVNAQKPTTKLVNFFASAYP